MWLLIIGIILVGGLLNPWTGLFGDTFYSPKRKGQSEPEKPEIKHRSFRLTKER
jgi:hypothetical protein